MWSTKFIIVTSLALLLIKTEQLHSQTKLSIAFDVWPGTNHTVVIQWNSKLEIDSLNYVIEKSTDKQTWQTIARIATQSSHAYSSIDSHPSAGLNYYRIKQMQNDGQIFFTDVKWIQINNADKFFLWPNPATSVLHIKTPFGKGSIDMFDSEGRFILKISINNFITDIPTANLSKGIYFLHIRHDKKTFTEKFVKD